MRRTPVLCAPGLAEILNETDPDAVPEAPAVTVMKLELFSTLQEHPEVVLRPTPPEVASEPTANERVPRL
jgi:hypothetical protein